MRHYISYALVTCVLSLATLTLQAQRTWTLRDCIAHAQAHNISIKQLRIAMQQRQIALNTAKNSRLPGVDASLAQGFNFGRGLNANNTYVSQNTQNTSLNVGLSVPLFTGFKLPNETKAAKLNLAASVADLDKAAEALSINVAQAYLQVLYQEELLKVAHDQWMLSQEQKARLDVLYKEGRIPEYDVIQAQANITQDYALYIQTDNARQLARLDLSQLLELPSPDSLQISAPDSALDTVMTGNPTSIFRQAVITKPAIQASEYRLLSAEKGVQIVRSGYWPTLSLTAGVGTSYFNIAGAENTPFDRQLNNNMSKSIGLSLSIPIFDRFATRNSIRQAKLNYADQALQLETSKKELYKEIQQAYYNALTAKQKYNASTMAEANAKVVHGLAIKKYEYGKSYITEYNEARNKWEKAKNERIQAKYEFLFRKKILDFYAGVPIE